MGLLLQSVTLEEPHGVFITAEPARRLPVFRVRHHTVEFAGIHFASSLYWLHQPGQGSRGTLVSFRWRSV